MLVGYGNDPAQAVLGGVVSAGSVQPSSKNLSETDKQKPDKPKADGEAAGPPPLSVVEKLNKTMFIKLQDIESKRERATALERRLSKMTDGPKKRQLVYQKQQEEALAIKYKRTPIDEERALHEAYQVLLCIARLSSYSVYHSKG